MHMNLKMQNEIRKAYSVFAYVYFELKAMQRAVGERVGWGGAPGRRLSRPGATAGRASRAAMVNTSCAVYRCGSTSHKHKGIRFHQFPRDERCPAWISACKRDDLKGKDAEQLKHMHICSLHFEQRMYGKQLLKKSAVPTLNLPATLTHTTATQTETFDPSVLQVCKSQGVQVCTSQGVQTDDEIFYVVSETETPPAVSSNPYCYDNNQRNYHEKDNLPAEINSLEDNSNYITIEQFLNGCDAFLPDGLNALIKSHITLSLEYNEPNFLP